MAGNLEWLLVHPVSKLTTADLQLSENNLAAELKLTHTPGARDLAKLGAVLRAVWAAQVYPVERIEGIEVEFKSCLLPQIETAQY
jgi:hypothetical protein